MAPMSSTLPLLACMLVGSMAESVKFNAKPSRFLIVSQPSLGQVTYMPVYENGKVGPPAALLKGGLVHPQGIAVDSKRSSLLVADPDLKQINSYKLTVSPGQVLVASEKFMVANNTEARWVAADGMGNIFFSDERANKIYRVSSGSALGGSGVLYDGSNLAPLNGPGGIAVDTFYTYWVNKHIGKQVGSLSRAAMEPDTTDPAASVKVLSRNTEKSYGVCVALSNVYYTQPENTIMGVKKTGGAVTTISDRLTNPRGCAWDGDGTVYVADRGANAVFSFAGNQQNLQAIQLTKAKDLKDAFGVAVFNAAGLRGPALGWLLLAASLSLLSGS